MPHPVGDRAGLQAEIYTEGRQLLALRNDDKSAALLLSQLQQLMTNQLNLLPADTRKGDPT